MHFVSNLNVLRSQGWWSTPAVLALGKMRWRSPSLRPGGLYIVRRASTGHTRHHFKWDMHARILLVRYRLIEAEGKTGSSRSRSVLNQNGWRAAVSVYEWHCAHMAWRSWGLMGQKREDFGDGRVYLQGSSPAVWKWQIAAGLVCGSSNQKLPWVLAVTCLPVQSASVYLRPLDLWPTTLVRFSVPPPPQTAAPKDHWGVRNVVLSSGIVLAFLCFPVSLYEEILLHAVLSLFCLPVFWFS